MSDPSKDELVTHAADPEDSRRTVCGHLTSAVFLTKAAPTCRTCVKGLAKRERIPVKRGEPPEGRFTMTTYQDRSTRTAIYPGHRLETDDDTYRALNYLCLKLGSEAGEVGDKWAKAQRDGDGELTRELSEAMAKELGDVLWYCAQIARVLGYSLTRIARMNLAKLASRQARGVLGGSGDDR